MTDEFYEQRDSNAENVPIWWRHHAGETHSIMRSAYLRFPCETLYRLLNRLSRKVEIDCVNSGSCIITIVHLPFIGTMLLSCQDQCQQKRMWCQLYQSPKQFSGAHYEKLLVDINFFPNTCGLLVVIVSAFKTHILNQHIFGIMIDLLRKGYCIFFKLSISHGNWCCKCGGGGGIPITLSSTSEYTLLTSRNIYYF